MSPFDALSPEQFMAKRETLGQRRAYFVFRPERGSLEPSHPERQDLAQAIQDDHRDYHRHEAMFFEVGPQSGALLGVFIHKTVRGQAAGGVRLWPYRSMRDDVRDGLRLGRRMGRKNALAGLWWGGGKGVIARPSEDQHKNRAYRNTLYREYGAFITSLRGCYVTAEDAGTTAPDMAEIFRTTRFVICVPTEVGGSGNPSFATAKGVVCAMEGALDALSMGTLEGKRIAVQGAGNVGGAAMIQELLNRNVASVVATDISESISLNRSLLLRGIDSPANLFSEDESQRPMHLFLGKTAISSLPMRLVESSIPRPLACSKPKSSAAPQTINCSTNTPMTKPWPQRVLSMSLTSFAIAWESLTAPMSNKGSCPMTPPSNVTSAETGKILSLSSHARCSHAQRQTTRQHRKRQTS